MRYGQTCGLLYRSGSTRPWFCWAVIAFWAVVLLPAYSSAKEWDNWHASIRTLTVGEMYSLEDNHSRVGLFLFGLGLDSGIRIDRVEKTKLALVNYSVYLFGFDFEHPKRLKERKWFDSAYLRVGPHYMKSFQENLYAGLQIGYGIHLTRFKASLKARNLSEIKPYSGIDLSLTATWTPVMGDSDGGYPMRTWYGVLFSLSLGLIPLFLYSL